MQTITAAESKRVFLHVRIETYALLACLLNQPPDPELLLQLQFLDWPPRLPERFAHAWTDLRNAACTYPAHLVRREFDALFIGVGQGEVVPYGSWYLEGMLMSRPLARLRQDLILAGIARRAEVREPEDHAGLLCQTMALLLQHASSGIDRYARFFQVHVAAWMGDFFSDLQKAPSAGFYRWVGALGHHFLQWESEQLRDTVSSGAQQTDR